MTTPRPSLRIHVIALIATALIGASAADATQHLLRPGDDLGRLAPRLRGGDEVILMPGRHVAADLENVRGTAELPIVIRSLDPANPSIIEAGRYGLRFLNPRHVRLEHLIVTGASIHGIVLAGERAPNGEPAGRITLRNVQVLETGPSGARHAIVAQHLDGLSLEKCTVRGWGGSGLEVSATRDVTIDGCRFEGAEKHTQLSGVRMRAGSANVFINECRFVDCGDQGVSIGAGSTLRDFPKDLPRDAAKGTLFEAANVEISKSVFVGGRSAIAFVNCERAIVRACTIHRPDRTVVSIRDEQKDPRFGNAARCRFGGNLVRWEPGDLRSLTHLAGGADASGVTVEENLWWTPNFSEVRESLGPFPGTLAFPQITDIDPKLDDDLVPQADDARYFGHRPR